MTRILLIPVNAEDSIAGYRIRVSAIVPDMFRKTSMLRAHERIAATVCKEACDDSKLAWLIRSNHNESWRATVRLESAKPRRQADSMQALGDGPIL